MLAAGVGSTPLLPWLNLAQNRICQAVLNDIPMENGRFLEAANRHPPNLPPHQVILAFNPPNVCLSGWKGLSRDPPTISTSSKGFPLTVPCPKYLWEFQLKGETFSISPSSWQYSELLPSSLESGKCYFEEKKCLFLLGRT